MSELKELKNNFESKCDMKIETNSRGHNTTVHVYQGVTLDEIDDTANKAVYAHYSLQDKLTKAEVVSKQDD